ncbi:MAG TPA: biotin-dependent carboxyltransferase family protein [Gemmatimonadaceae bacterium]|nr:biotin-dependent carboxyltransferase family protein [Gemmatimonadaceae bacterium]
MSLRILRPGMFTTVQDLGRSEHQRFGVPVSGAMDSWALRVANLLVGNDEGDAALEVTLTGPTIRFETGALIAITGADLGATLGEAPLAPWHAACAPSGAMLSFGGAAVGCRAYIAIAGGIPITPVLGSRSTFVRAALGGYMGRPLRRGDVLPCGEPSSLARRIASATGGGKAGATVARWSAGAALRPAYSAAPTVRVLPGTHAHLLSAPSADRLYGATFGVSPQSDRMGYRLQGCALELGAPAELLSEGVAFGTVQLPPGGDPIILMADRQTTGGYPRIGEVATVDLPLVAQLRPGDSVRFRRVSLERAQALYLAREHDLAEARRAIALRFPE